MWDLTHPYVKTANLCTSLDTYGSDKLSQGNILNDYDNILKS